MRVRRARVSVMAAMAQGRRALTRGELPAAIRLFDRAISLDPQCAQAVLYRAGLKLLADDQDGALADFQAMSCAGGQEDQDFSALCCRTTVEACPMIAAVPVAAVRCAGLEGAQAKYCPLPQARRTNNYASLESDKLPRRPGSCKVDQTCRSL